MKIIIQEIGFDGFPLIKRRYFWGSGFWGSQLFADSVGRDPDQIRNYVKNQGKHRPEKSLKAFFTTAA